MLGVSPRREGPLTGSSGPHYVAADAESVCISPGSGYFLLQVRNAQAIFRASLLEQAKSLVVTSRVWLRHSGVASDPIFGIQRSYTIERNVPQRLGLSANLMRLTPATADVFSIALEFIVDKQNRLSPFADLINSRSLIEAFSPHPATAAVAKAVGTLSEKLLRTLLPKDEQQPVLKFQGDFNLALGLRSGYYVILASRDSANPLPETPRLEVREDVVFVDGQTSRDWSWVLLQLSCVPYRTRSLAGGAPWESKLLSAEAEAERVAIDLLARKADRESAMRTCTTLLREAQILLLHDPNYLASEAHLIIRETLEQCQLKIFRSRVKGGYLSVGEATEPSPVRAARAELGFDADDPARETLTQYAHDVKRSLRILEQFSAP